MPSYDPSLFNTNPYYDDFSEEKKFLRMLFRPGFSVQSRELTQLQTILQNQIERFGNHVFKDGSRIIGGEISTQTLDFVRLNPSTQNGQVEIADSDVVGYNLTQKDGSGITLAQARVVDFIGQRSGDPYGIAVVSYLSGSQFTQGAVLECSNPLRNDIVPVVATTSGTGFDSQGKCKVVGVNKGIYYIDGYFVRIDDQFEPAYTLDTQGKRLFTSPTGFMGLDVVSEIVTEGEDYTLKDPASGSYNYNAPGAHRYRINLVLKFIESMVGENFIELVRYESGSITRKNESTQYAELLKLFAQRTYDESGNYIVRPFDISFRDGGGSTLHADIGSGKAYVFGYEYETKFKDTIEVPKARATKTYEDYSVGNFYGNFIKAKYSSNTASTDYSDINPIFYSIRQDKSSKAHLVYGATGATALSGAFFTANLIGVRNTDSVQTSESGRTMDFSVYLGNIQYNKSIPAGISGINLYHINESTNVSSKLFSNIELAYASGVTNVKVYEPSEISLVYPVNGSTPTTLTKNVSELQYVHEVYRGFFVNAFVDLVSVPLSLGVNFNWCKRNGSVPTGSNVQIDDDDGYYLIYASGTAMPVGTILKIVSPNTNVPTGTKVTGQISGDGDIVYIPTLPNGQYYLVGKSKNNSLEMDSDGTDLNSRIRTKARTTASETFTSTLSTLDTFKRVIKRNSSNQIYELYFVLNRSDVSSITSIVQTNADGTTSDISNRFLLDNGQRDSVYDLARLYAKPDWFATYEIPFPSFTVQYSYFTHSGFGPFTVESYRGISYQDIPIFTSVRTGKSMSLANAIDYRYVAQIDGYVPSGASAGTIVSSNPNSTSNRPIISYYDGFSPDPFSLVNTSTAYLPRIDKLVVSKNISADGDSTTLQRISGVASDSPLVPEDLSDSMTLFVLSVPPYTFGANDVKAEYIGNSRFTMKDIGGISKRVDNLEQYAILNELEASVVSRSIKVGTAGDEAIKKAIMVDSFEGHSVGDIADGDYRCSIDVEKGELRPSFTSEAYDFSFSGSFSGITLTSDNILCYDYSRHPTPIISQQKASTTIKVNTFDLPNWVGSMNLRPHADYWYDNDIRPVIRINDNGMNDAWAISNMNGSFGHGSQWNDWESIWDGISVELNDAESQKNASFFSRPRNIGSIGVVSPKFISLDGINRSADTSSVRKNSYISQFKRKNFYSEVATNTLLNKSVVPYMRGARTITFSAYNLKPKTQVHVFFDNVNVNRYCTLNGSTGPFTTDSTNGSLTNVVFTVPSGMFGVGEKILRLIDDSNNDIENATTLSEASFYASGVKSDDLMDISSVRPMEIRKQTPNSNKVVSNPLFREKSINTSSYTQWMDPLTQTFVVSQNSYPDGFFAESIDLYFSSKDDSLPVSVEIHPVVNGVPHHSMVLPFSTVILNPSSVNVNGTVPTTATNFKFSSPLYLEPGEYAIVVKSNSSRYSVFAGTIGDFDLATNERISSTLPSGTLLMPQNGSERTGDSSMDLMFGLNRCQFTPPSGSILLGNKYSGSQDNSNADLVQPNPFVFSPSGVAVSTRATIGSSSYDVVPNRNLPLPTRFSVDAANDLRIELTPTVSRPNFLSPMIDMDRTNMVVVENIVDSSNSTTTETTPSSGQPNEKTARYITRKISLPKNETADELKVIFDANIPSGAFVKVYAKTLNSQSVIKSIDTTDYQLMGEVSPSPFSLGSSTTNSSNAFDFREVLYSLRPSEAFDTFTVKICMYSSDPTKVPVVKNLKVVAVE